MYFRTIRNDILRSKAITLTTMLFITTAAMLVALAVILVVNLTGAIDTLMTRAQTPHFMQMHAGALDMTRLTTFAGKHKDVADFQVMEFLNMDGAQIVFPGGSLAGSVQDNGFSVQSEHFDFLLDLDGNIIQAADGELYVPISYMQDDTTSIGDRVEVAGKALVVTGFLRDSQMNSLLSSSKRFLVSHNDFAALKDSGSMEYLIEFRLHDLDALGTFETAYAAAELEAAGPTLTYPLFKMINAISDGMMIALLLLVSLLIVAIAFLCIRFTLLAKIEDEYREIGAMKAIGLRVSDIKQIYLAKYAALAAAGSVLGLALSFVFRNALLANIWLHMGESANAAQAPLLGGLGVLLLFGGVLVYVNGVLEQFRRISPAEAIRFGIVQGKTGGIHHFNLSQNRLLGVNVFLGAKDVLTRKRLYVTMLTVLVLAAFISILPQNLYTTIASKDFSTYMGIGDSDLRIDLQQMNNIAVKATDIAQALENDKDISRYVVLTTYTFRVRMPDGTQRRIPVELGDHTVFPVAYAAGRAPTAADEIALSVLHANELGRQVGDSLILLVGGQEQQFTVCGLYSDVTNGGKTAKAAFSDATADIVWSVISAELVDETRVDEKAAEYATKFAFAKVTGIEGYIVQTFGSTIRAVAQAARVASVVAVLITILITVLFMRMLIVKDRYSIAVMKIFGFTNTDIKMQYLSRAVFVLLIGVSLGTLLANTLGETLVGAAISFFGAASFKFTINPFFAYLLSPLLMAGAVLVATGGGTLDAGQIIITGIIKE
ncbi:MAG: ABC transporter permease [Anaerolineae bacterium]|nr:ABC transporter permease [Anaerolineae bacterium]